MGVRVLLADPDLAAGLTPPELELAQRALVGLVVEVAPGQEGELTRRVRIAQPQGLLLLEGLILRETEVAGVVAAELMGEGDVMLPRRDERLDLIPGGQSVSWRALTPLRLVVLDDVFAERAARWPQVGWQLTRRTLARSHAAAVQLAICNRPRVQDRLHLMLWHLAGRWGRVTSDGVRLDLPLTHGVLGKLVGAHRPSVTTALGSLTRRRLVVRDGDGWILHEPPPGP